MELTFRALGRGQEQLANFGMLPTFAYFLSNLRSIFVSQMLKMFSIFSNFGGRGRAAEIQAEGDELIEVAKQNRTFAVQARGLAMISMLKSHLVLSGRAKLLTTGATLLLLFTGAPAFANVTDFVQNSDFAGAANGELNFDTTVPDWTAPAFPASYVFLWDAAPGDIAAGDTTADTTGAQGFYKGGPTNPVKLWGPGDGSSNGLTASGAFIGSSPAFHDGPISQTLTGLTVGKPVVVSFDYAGAQQFGFSGPSEEGWAVSLGSETKDTAQVSISSHGFSGWKTASFTFTPTSSSEVLKFMAIGSTNDVEQFALLSGVNADSTVGVIPEPSTWVLMGLGFMGLGFARYRHTRRAKPQAA